MRSYRGKLRGLLLQPEEAPDAAEQVLGRGIDLGAPGRVEGGLRVRAVEALAALDHDLHHSLRDLGSGREDRLEGCLRHDSDRERAVGVDARGARIPREERQLAEELALLEARHRALASVL